MSAIAVAAGAVAYALRDASAAHRDFAGSMREALDAGDRLREGDRHRMERLQELAQKQRLSNHELAEAKRLAAELGETYGGLGITIDEQTQQVKNMTEAWRRFADAQIFLAVLQVEQALDEARAAADAAYKKATSLWHSHKRRQELLRTEYDPAELRVLELERRLEKLKAGQYDAASPGEPSASGGPSPAAGGPAVSGGPRSDPEAAAALALQWEQRVHRMRLENLADEAERERALTNERYDRELKRAKGNAKAIAAIEEARTIELERLRETMAKKTAEQTIGKLAAGVTAATQQIQGLWLAAGGSDLAAASKDLGRDLVNRLGGGDGDTPPIRRRRGSERILQRTHQRPSDVRHHA